MYFIKAGDLEILDSKPLEQKKQFQDFEKAKRMADKLLLSFAQVEVVDSKTNECVYFQTRGIKSIPSSLENLAGSKSTKEVLMAKYGKNRKIE